MLAKKRKRLLATLTGHHHQLLAAFKKSSAHKLPSAKGALREKAVADFVQTWTQKRFCIKTNVFAITRSGNEFPSELDLVVHDSNSGAIWNLDDEGANCVATWEEIKLIAQIKSRLGEKEFNDACKTVSKIDCFAESVKTERPLRLLFSYQTTDSLWSYLEERFNYTDSRKIPFDAFVLLDKGAYFSYPLRELRVGIEHGLSPAKALNDKRAQSAMIQEDCLETAQTGGYAMVGDGSPENTLLAFAALIVFATSGDELTGAFLSACQHSEYSPIFD